MDVPQSITKYVKSIKNFRISQFVEVSELFPRFIQFFLNFPANFQGFFQLSNPIQSSCQIEKFYKSMISGQSTFQSAMIMDWRHAIYKFL